MTEWGPDETHAPGPDWTCSCGYDYYGATYAYSLKLYLAHLPDAHPDREAFS